MSKEQKFTFDVALQKLRVKERVGRKSWPAAQFLFLVPGSEFEVSRAPLLGIYPAGTKIVYSPHIDVSYARGRVAVWNPAMDDVLADDWYSVTTG